MCALCRHSRCLSDVYGLSSVLAPGTRGRTSKYFIRGKVALPEPTPAARRFLIIDYFALFCFRKLQEQNQQKTVQHMMVHLVRQKTTSRTKRHLETAMPPWRMAPLRPLPHAMRDMRHQHTAHDIPSSSPHEPSCDLYAERASLTHQYPEIRGELGIGATTIRVTSTGITGVATTTRRGAVASGGIGAASWCAICCAS